MSPQGYKNMDLESQDPIFNANLGQDENLIWTKKLRCSHSMMLVESRFSEGCLVLKSFPCTSAFKKPITINVLGKEQIGFFTKFGKRQQYPFHFHGVNRR